MNDATPLTPLHYGAVCSIVIESECFSNPYYVEHVKCRRGAINYVIQSYWLRKISLSVNQTVKTQVSPKLVICCIISIIKMLF